MRTRTSYDPHEAHNDSPTQHQSSFYWSRSHEPDGATGQLNRLWETTTTSQSADVNKTPDIILRPKKIGDQLPVGVSNFRKNPGVFTKYNNRDCKIKMAIQPHRFPLSFVLRKVIAGSLDPVRVNRFKARMAASPNTFALTQSCIERRVQSQPNHNHQKGFSCQQRLLRADR